MKRLLPTACLLPILLTACSPVNLPPMSEYTFNVQPSTVVRGPEKGPSLLVLQPDAAPGYQSKRMVYMITPYQLQSYTKSTWAAPPAQMMVPVLVDSLRHTRHFKAVAAPPFLGKTDCQLAVYLEALDQSFMRPVSQVRLVLHATLTRSISHQVLAAKTVTRRISAPGNNAYAGVIATNEAMRSASKDIAEFAARYCPK